MRQNQLVAVAERGHWREQTSARITKLRRQYEQRPLAAILLWPCMEFGDTRRRFEKMIGDTNVDRRVNLLPPDNKPGTWDGRLSVAAATILLEWADDTDSHLILLGRRVTDAFQEALGHRKSKKFPRPRNPIPFGETFARGRLLCVPHPSGMSRAMNDPDVAAQITRAIEEFRTLTTEV